MTIHEDCRRTDQHEPHEWSVSTIQRCSGGNGGKVIRAYLPGSNRPMSVTVPGPEPDSSNWHVGYTGSPALADYWERRPVAVKWSDSMNRWQVMDLGDAYSDFAMGLARARSWTPT